MTYDSNNNDVYIADPRIDGHALLLFSNAQWVRNSHNEAKNETFRTLDLLKNTDI